MQSSRHPVWPSTTAICTFSRWLARLDGIILSTIPSIVVLGFSGFRVVSISCSAILADLDMRGSVSSFMMPADIEYSDDFAVFLCGIYLSWYMNGSRAAPFCTACQIY